MLLESGKYFIIIMDSGRLTWKSGCIFLATSVQKDCLEREWNRTRVVQLRSRKLINLLVKRDKGFGLFKINQGQKKDYESLLKYLG